MWGGGKLRLEDNIDLETNGGEKAIDKFSLQTRRLLLMMDVRF